MPTHTRALVTRVCQQIQVRNLHVHCMNVLIKYALMRCNFYDLRQNYHGIFEKK